MARLTRAIAIALSLYAVYWVVGVVEPFFYRTSFLLLALVLVFLAPTLPPGESAAAPVERPRVGPMDWALAAATVLTLAMPLLATEAFVARAATPTLLDAVAGAVVIGLVLEATRRTAGSVLPATALLFLGYAYFGPLLDLVGLNLLAHRGYPLDRLIATQWMTLEGIFGVPLDVASTYLILFTIFGAVLDRTGAGRFFVDWALAAMGRAGGRSGAGRAVVAAGFLLGMVSGSGVATTVTLASCSWPMLERAGADRETGAAIFAASGIGAILAPPALGAAAFLIAEFVGIPYRQVIAMAVVPAALYYVSVILMIEGDARRAGITGSLPVVEPIGGLTRRWGQFFIAPLLMILLLAAGMSAFRAVAIATAVAIAAGWLRRESRLGPAGILDALAQGGMAILPIIATTATAGIIVGVVTLTGLGLNLAGIIVSLAAGHALLTVLYAAVAVWMLGLAVPVTASYIIAAVMIVPALTQVGIPLLAAHMFVFYYAVLSEVTPPTALAPMAAAAITRASPYVAMMRTWKYTLPAFVVPIAFVVDARGMGLLLQAPWGVTLAAVGSALGGVAALATGASGWLGAPLGWGARTAFIAAGFLLILPGTATDLAGAVLAIGAALPWLTRRGAPS